MKGEKQSNQRCVGKLVTMLAMEAESHRVLRIAHFRDRRGELSSTGFPAPLSKDFPMGN